jgi:hypothetical protein
VGLGLPEHDAVLTERGISPIDSVSVLEGLLGIESLRVPELIGTLAC